MGALEEGLSKGARIVLVRADPKTLETSCSHEVPLAAVGVCRVGVRLLLGSVVVCVDLHLLVGFFNLSLPLGVPLSMHECQGRCQWCSLRLSCVSSRVGHLVSTVEDTAPVIEKLENVLMSRLGKKNGAVFLSMKGFF